MGEVRCLDLDGFHDGTDDGRPEKEEPARLFDMMKAEDPAEDKVAPIVAALDSGKLEGDLRGRFAAAGMELPAEVTVKADAAAKGPAKRWTFQAQVGPSQRDFLITLAGPRLSAFKILTPDDKEEADVIWVDGHSDYGHAFEVFWQRYGKDVGPKTTVLLLGDARNNYHATQSWVVKEMQHRARHVYWLNPEPKSYWDTGDSIVGEYATHCDGVFECRNLRQLERFIDHLA